MICRCRNCGGSIEWKNGDAAGVCMDCGAKGDGGLKPFPFSKQFFIN